MQKHRFVKGVTRCRSLAAVVKKSLKLSDDARSSRSESSDESDGEIRGCGWPGGVMRVWWVGYHAHAWDCACGVGLFYLWAPLLIAQL